MNSSVSRRVHSSGIRMKRKCSKRLFESLIAALASDQPVDDLLLYIRQLLETDEQMESNIPKPLDTSASRIGLPSCKDIKLPMVIVLGPSEEDISRLCTKFVTRYQTKTIFVSLANAISKSGRLGVEGFSHYNQLPSCATINEFLNLVIGLNEKYKHEECDGIVISGFPRSVKDLEEIANNYVNLKEKLQDVLKGVVLINYNLSTLQDILGDKELTNYQNTVLNVAEAFNQHHLLSVIDGPMETPRHASSLLLTNYEMPLNQFALIVIAIWAKNHSLERPLSKASRRTYDLANGISDDSDEIDLDELREIESE